MSSPFVAEIRIVGFNFAPTGWAECDGQLLPISQNTALFSLLGTFYGGDGKSTFALPDFQGRAPMGTGQGPGLSDRFLGESSGESGVTLITTEIPSHFHTLQVNHNPGEDPTPGGESVARPVGGSVYAPPGNTVQLAPLALGVIGSSFPHNNMQPYLVLNFIIAMQGIFPPR